MKVLTHTLLIDTLLNVTLKIHRKTVQTRHVKIDDHHCKWQTHGPCLGYSAKSFTCLLQFSFLEPHDVQHATIMRMKNATALTHLPRLWSKIVLNTKSFCADRQSPEDSCMALLTDRNTETRTHGNTDTRKHGQTRPILLPRPLTREVMRMAFPFFVFLPNWANCCQRAVDYFATGHENDHTTCSKATKPAIPQLLKWETVNCISYFCETECSRTCHTL